MGGSGGRLRLFHLVELDEATIADCGGDMAGTIMFVAGALHNQEHDCNASRLIACEQFGRQIAVPLILEGGTLLSRSISCRDPRSFV
jgi:hypothetical protein